MHSPPHPGLTLRDDVLPALALTVTDAAAALGVTSPALSRVLNGDAAISPEMALRLERWLGVENGGRADVWLGMQASYDLWTLRQSEKSTNTKTSHVTEAGGNVFADLGFEQKEALALQAGSQRIIADRLKDHDPGQVKS